MRILRYVYAVGVGFLAATILTGSLVLFGGDLDLAGLGGLHVIAWAVMSWSVVRSRRKAEQALSEPLTGAHRPNSRQAAAVPMPRRILLLSALIVGWGLVFVYGLGITIAGVLLFTRGTDGDWETGDLPGLLFFLAMVAIGFLLITWANRRRVHRRVPPVDVS